MPTLHAHRPSIHHPGPDVERPGAGPRLVQVVIGRHDTHLGLGPSQHGRGDGLPGLLLQQVTDQRGPGLARAGDDRAARHIADPSPYRFAVDVITQSHRGRLSVEPVSEGLRCPPRPRQEPHQLDINSDIDMGFGHGLLPPRRCGAVLVTL